MIPRERFVDQRRQPGAASAEDHRVDRDAFWVVDFIGSSRALRDRRGEAAVRMRALNGLAVLVGDALFPRAAEPVERLLRGLAFAVFPPDRLVFGVENDVGEDRVLLGGGERIRVAFRVCARRDAEEAVFRIHRPEASVGSLAQPGDVVADGRDLVALMLQPFRRDEHREVGFSAGAGEGGGDVAGFAVLLKAEDQHMLGEPSFLLREPGGDAKAEAFFSKQGVPAVAGTDRPDRIVLREVQDQAPLGVEVRLAVKAFRKLPVGTQGIEHGLSHAGHDAHAQADVNRVGQLHADLREGGTDRAHREGDHVHRTPLHRVFENLARLCVSFGRLHPVVGRSRVLFLRGADEGEVFDPGDVLRIGAVVKAAGELFLVQSEQLPGGYGLVF